MCARSRANSGYGTQPAVRRDSPVGELEQVAFIEQPQLQGFTLDQRPDLPALERRDPAQSGALAQRLDMRLSDHALVAHQHHFC